MDTELEYVFGQFVFLPSSRLVRNEEHKCVSLIRRYADILSLLAQAEGRIVAKSDLYATIFTSESLPKLKIVDVYVCTLRKRLRKLHPGNAGQHIVTVWGKGYYLSQTPVQVRRVLKVKRLKNRVR